MEKKPFKRQQESKEIMEEDIPFVPSLLAEAYSKDEPEYTTEDLIWKNPGEGDFTLFSHKYSSC